MQLSTKSELNRLLRFWSFESSEYSLNKSESMINYPNSFQDILNDSPPCSFEENLLKTSEKSEVFVENLSTDISNKQALLNITEPSMLQNNIRVFLFGNSDYLDLITNPQTTILKLIKLTLLTYLKTEKFQYKMLPFGPNPEAYQLWLADEVFFMPEKELLLDKQFKINDLKSKYFTLTALDSFSDEIKLNPLRKISEIAPGQALKVYFEENSTVVSVNPNSSIREILPVLCKKFPDLEFLNPADYEFKVLIDSEMDKEECIVDPNVQLKFLRNNELSIIKKVYADTPAFSVKNPEYDKLPVFNKVFMSKAQACAYKEFEVFDGFWKEKKILGVNQLRINFMSLEESKRSIKQKARSQKGIVAKIIEDFFRINDGFDILLDNIINAGLDPQNPFTFFINFYQETVKKTVIFQTENKFACEEIVTKISLLKNLMSDLRS